MITKEWLKDELDKIDDRIYWEIDGYGNIDHVVSVFNKYLETQVKTCNLPHVSNNEVAVCDHKIIKKGFHKGRCACGLFKEKQ